MLFVPLLPSTQNKKSLFQRHHSHMPVVLLVGEREKKQPRAAYICIHSKLMKQMWVYRLMESKMPHTTDWLTDWLAETQKERMRKKVKQKLCKRDTRRKGHTHMRSFHIQCRWFSSYFSFIFSWKALHHLRSNMDCMEFMILKIHFKMCTTEADSVLNM